MVTQPLLLLVSLLLATTHVEPAAALVPAYTAARPNYQKPNGGLPLLPGAEHHTVFESTPALGTYNHQAQIERHGGAFSHAP
jgi:hypothetical protein